MFNTLVDNSGILKNSLFINNIKICGMKISSYNSRKDFSVMVCSSEEESLQAKFIPHTMTIIIGPEKGFCDLYLEKADEFPPFDNLKEFEDLFFKLIHKKNEHTVYKNLCAKAIDVQKNSRNTYSHFSVGASVLSCKGNIYTGTNVENSSFGATICAERSAIMAGVAAEGKDFKIDKLVCSTPTDWPGSPCGICLQVISDLAADEKTEILLIGKNGRCADLYTIMNLLPRAFLL